MTTPHRSQRTAAGLAEAEEALLARKSHVAAVNRRFGRGLSIAGVTLVALSLAVLFGGGLVLTWVDQCVAAGADRDQFDGLAGIAMGSLAAVPAIILLFAMCCLIPGEQLRRGWIAPSSTLQKGPLSMASMVSEFRVLGFGWHVLWSTIGLVVTALLSGIPVVSWFTGAWPETVSDDYGFSGLWMIYGSFALGITLASFTSLIKKLGYLRQYRIRGETISDGGPGRTFWRWVDYRWRFDLWLTGAGGVLLGLSPTVISEAVGPYGSADALSAELPDFIRLAGSGVLLVSLGIAAALNFWRAGEPLGSAESAA